MKIIHSTVGKRHVTFRVQANLLVPGRYSVGLFYPASPTSLEEIAAPYREMMTKLLCILPVHWVFVNNHSLTLWGYFGSVLDSESLFMAVKLLEAYPKIEILAKKSAHTAYFHVKKQLTTKSGFYQITYRQERTAPDYVNQLFGIEGVETVWLEPYHVQIDIADLFDWVDDGIEEKVKTILSNHLKTLY